MKKLTNSSLPSLLSSFKLFYNFFLILQIFGEMEIMIYEASPYFIIHTPRSRTVNSETLSGLVKHGLSQKKRRNGRIKGAKWVFQYAKCHKLETLCIYIYCTRKPLLASHSVLLHKLFIHTQISQKLEHDDRGMNIKMSSNEQHDSITHLLMINITLLL